MIADPVNQRHRVLVVSFWNFGVARVLSSLSNSVNTYSQGGLCCKRTNDAVQDKEEKQGLFGEKHGED